MWRVSVFFRKAPPAKAGGALLQEDFQRFWSYVSPKWADKFLEDWAKRTMRTKLKPMKKVAKMLRAHKELILNWFRANGDLSSSR